MPQNPLSLPVLKFRHYIHISGPANNGFTLKSGKKLQHFIFLAIEWLQVRINLLLRALRRAPDGGDSLWTAKAHWAFERACAVGGEEYHAGPGPAGGATQLKPRAGKGAQKNKKKIIPITSVFPLIISILILASCDKYSRLLKSTNYELKYQKAEEYFEKKQYTRSSQLYEELIPVFKGTDKAEHIYHRFAWSEYLAGDNLLAQYHFRNFTRQFPNSKNVEECHYMSAYCYFLNSPNFRLDQSYTKNAIKEFQSFVDAYPESRRIDTCNILIDKLRGKLERKDYEIIKQYYRLMDHYMDPMATVVAGRNFIKEYPSSNYNEEMNYLIIEAWYKLALNSVHRKKEERLNSVIENYVKFVDLYPNSSYLGRVEDINNSARRMKDNLSKHGL
jgi:outer membrane protein assembly factor BamD